MTRIELACSIEGATPVAASEPDAVTADEAASGTNAPAAAAFPDALTHAPSAGQPQSFETASLAPLKIGIQAAPDHIERGKTCGMSWMCGEHPCLCGTSDEWGDCACNGTETLPCDIHVEATGNMAAFPLAGSWYALPLRPGAGDITVTASLDHYESAQEVLHIEAGPVSALSIGGAAVVVMLIATLLAIAMRAARTHGRAPAPTPGEKLGSGADGESSDTGATGAGDAEAGAAGAVGAGDAEAGAAGAVAKRACGPIRPEDSGTRP